MESIIDLRNIYRCDSTQISKWEYAEEAYKYHQSLFDYSHILYDTDIESITIKDNQVIMKFRESGLFFVCKEGDERSMMMDALNFGSYEKKEMNVIHRIISLLKRKHLLDIGANIGYTSCLWAKSFPQAVIHSFEPIPKTFEQLNSNIELNKINNIVTHNYGVSNVNETVKFYYYPWCAANSSLNNIQHKDNCVEVQGEIKRLDDIDWLRNFEIDFIKCDIEGNELFAFKGAEELIRKNKPIIYTEILRKYSSEFGYNANDILSLFKKNNYVCCYVSADEKLIEIDEMMATTSATNFIFFHKEEHSELLYLIGGEIHN